MLSTPVVQRLRRPPTYSVRRTRTSAGERLHILCDASPARRDWGQSDAVTGRRSATDQALGSNLCVYVLVGVMLHSCCSETNACWATAAVQKAGSTDGKDKSP
ncbi:hypothetical protein K491DRAFT_688571 [Lophiostoma macrostomum CBS 122681]|uniref:Uncharacterized protein n=1 Tax=Lophiostoma macrostomum CBS 122681 TaxID=1314788 RepID=A0A6A6TKG9_9PLEO|nr:hypothetical protein K491DRAFT_688571 [Lophiostoma macrostomum CBS 122681]